MDIKLGKLRIDVEFMGNKIQVFNSPKVCSLVINNEVFDTYKGLAAGIFELHGKIQTPDNEEKDVLVEMSIFAMMRVYCNGIQIAKKWIPFG